MTLSEIYFNDYYNQIVSSISDCTYNPLQVGDWIIKPPIKPIKILKNPEKNATTVFWNDGTKTVVKKSPDDPDDDYFAFTSALAIKTYGSNSKLHRMLKEKTEILKKKDKRKDS